MSKYRDLLKSVGERYGFTPKFGQRLACGSLWDDLEEALQQVERDVMEMAPKICARHTCELKMKARIAVLAPKDCVYCHVERQTWEAAINLALESRSWLHEEFWPAITDLVSAMRDKLKQSGEDTHG